jgi:hypothetical protein|tara:strand:+ start:450 stop:1025 length:576 start_codon:yes stop_codon:yes gene_type:complete
MIDLLDEMEADREAASQLDNVTTGGLQQVTALAQDISVWEQKVNDLDESLKAAKAKLMQLTDYDLPDVMQEIGLTNFTLADGSKLEIKATYGARIPVEHREAAFAWLQEKGYDDIIKNMVSVPFGRGEDSSATEFMELAQKSGYLPDQKKEVHPQTLKAFVKEQLEKGTPVPMDLFGVFTGHRATIKRGSK